MKIVTFDVANGSCALAVDRNGNSKMLDCGSHSNKDNPVDLIKIWKTDDGWLRDMRVNRFGFRGCIPICLYRRRPLNLSSDA